MIQECQRRQHTYSNLLRSVPGASESSNPGHYGFGNTASSSCSYHNSNVGKSRLLGLLMNQRPNNYDISVSVCSFWSLSFVSIEKWYYTTYGRPGMVRFTATKFTFENYDKIIQSNISGHSTKYRNWRFILVATLSIELQPFNQQWSKKRCKFLSYILMWYLRRKNLSLRQNLT